MNPWPIGYALPARLGAEGIRNEPKRRTNMTGETDRIDRAEPGGLDVGIDDSPTSEAALEWAATWVRSLGPQLRAMHVLNPATLGSASATANLLVVGTQDRVGLGRLIAAATGSAQ